MSSPRPTLSGSPDADRKLAELRALLAKLKLPLGRKA
jgi:hypothetical protein